MHFSKTQRDHIPFEVEFKVTDLYNFTRIFSDFFCAKSKYINCGGLFKLVMYVQKAKMSTFKYDEIHCNSFPLFYLL